ncbi:MAG: serine protease [Paracoccaceae bacterium]
MYSFIKNNIYLIIAFITITWSIINNVPSDQKTNTTYIFAKKDENFITNQKNELNLRKLNRYRLNTKSNRNQSGSGTAFYVGENIWITARHVINDCNEVYLKTGSNNQFIEKILIHPNSDLALFKYKSFDIKSFGISQKISETAFSSGYPAGKPGDAVLQLAGFMAMEARSYNILEKHSIYAVLEKNPKSLLSFGGISGGPAFDEYGLINGVVVAEFKRRGLLGAVGLNQINWLISASKKEIEFLNNISKEKNNNIKLDNIYKNYIKIGHELRGNKSISKVICIA